MENTGNCLLYQTAGERINNIEQHMKDIMDLQKRENALIQSQLVEVIRQNKDTGKKIDTITCKFDARITALEDTHRKMKYWRWAVSSPYRIAASLGALALLVKLLDKLPTSLYERAFIYLTRLFN